MTTLNEALDELLPYFKGMKEHVCRNKPTDLSPKIVLFRAGRVVAMIETVQDLKHIQEIARVAAAGFDADYTFIVAESWTFNYESLTVDDDDTPINPATGKPLQYGDINDLAVNHQGVARGWITECVMIWGVNRAGDGVAANLAFRYSGKHLVWGREMTGGDDFFVGTAINDLKKSMSGQSVTTFLAMINKNVDREEQDVIVLKMLREKFKHKCEVYLVTEPQTPSRTKNLKAHGGFILHDPESDIE